MASSLNKFLCAEITDFCHKENLNTSLFQYREKEIWHPLTNRRITTGYPKKGMTGLIKVVLVTLLKGKDNSIYGYLL